VNTSARYLAADDYPIGIPAEVAEALLAQIDQLWGTEALVAMMVPSRAGDERFRRWFAKGCVPARARGPPTSSCTMNSSSRAPSRHPPGSRR
jgi:hypothetical protein